MAFPTFQERLLQLFRRAKFDGGAVSRSTPVVEVVQKWNNPNEVFVGKVNNTTDYGSAAASVLERWSRNGASVVDVTKTGINIAYGNGFGISFGGQATIGNTIGMANTFNIVAGFLDISSASIKLASGSVTLTGNIGAQTNLTITPGVAANPFVGGALNLNGGTGKGSGNTGGAVNITGGSGDGTGNYTGSNVVLSGGAGAGTGVKGIVTASRLRVDGFATATAAKTADYTATLDDGTIEVDASGAARTITLFACSANAGKILVIKKTDSSANAVTIDGGASETIDGATTISLASQYSTAILQVNAAGTGWNKLGGV